MDEREQARHYWLEKNLVQFEPLVLLTGDASSRRYFRLYSQGDSYVLMDAPCSERSCQDFITISGALKQRGLQVPEVYYADIQSGFLLLSDFGDHTLLSRLNHTTVHKYYGRALDDLLTLQCGDHVSDYEMPSFNEALYSYELNLFHDWYLKRHLGMQLSSVDLQILDRTNHLLIECALSQPQVWVHRDYHSRNLMVLPDHKLGILDFQDAVWGPITYDLVSLLCDCYIQWPKNWVRQWVLVFHRHLLTGNRLVEENPEQFLLWFDWMALQRHLKCLGIFSRLHYRDHKSSYLKNIPRVLNYIRSVCEKYSEFTPFLNRFIL